MQSGTLDFGFGNTIIKVPYSEWIWQPAAEECYFGARAGDPAVSSSWVLGGE
jgi:hypothetical protein